MKKFLTRQFFPALLLALAVVTARADDETAQFAILHSDASVAQKWAACQKLRVIGTVKSVPEVAALLTDEHLSQAARQTLGGLPYPEVDDALREALGKTTGLLKAGIVDSIGWRGKPAALPLLVPLLSDSDPDIAATAATALGRIGGDPAATALWAAHEQPNSTVRGAILASLLQCAESMAESNNQSGSAAIYRELFDEHFPVGIRTAAWRGLVLSDPASQVDLMSKALSGTDHAVKLVALKVLRDSNDNRLIEACAGLWESLPAESQLAVLDAEVRQGRGALPFVRTASRSPRPAIRIAAWAAMGDLNDLESIGALAQSAIAEDAAERQAARDSLARLRGPGAFEAFMAELKRATPPEKGELLRALAARRDGQAVDVLVENAAAGDESVRIAALQSLTDIAPQAALRPLLEIAEKASSDDLRNQAMEALSAICQKSSDKDAATRAVIEAQNNLSAAQRGELFPLLAELGTADALAAVQAASRNQNIQTAKEAVRALSAWPDGSPAEGLLDLARTATDTVLRTLALRGAITVCATETVVARRLAILQQAMAEATRPDERKLALSQVGQVPTPEALSLALKSISDPIVNNEAALAVVTIAEKLAPSRPELADEAAVKVLQQHTEGDLFRRAWALRVKPGRDVSFIRDWLVCGPFSKPGITGAKAVFNVTFGPETTEKSVEWKAVPSEDVVNLGTIFPGAENCAAYLWASVDVPEDCSAALLMGSDDGIKAWLNGAVVHSNNVDRGEVADQDIAPIKLKKGANELVLKITQGGGGWSACARIVGVDGKPITGLVVQRPSGSVGNLKNTE